MEKAALYRSKFRSIQQVLDQIQSGDTIAGGWYGNEPAALLGQLHTIAPRVTDVTVWVTNPVGDYPFINDVALNGRIDLLSVFYNRLLHQAHRNGRVSLIPANLHSLAETMIRAKRPNLFLAACTPMDENGCVQLPCSQQAEYELLAAADRVILEVNPALPHTFGTVNVPVERVDAFVAVSYPVASIEEPPLNDTDRAIAANVATLVRDGDCIQLGIGSMPNAVGEALRDKQELGIHTEMITTSMARLMACGAVTNSRKTLHPGKTIGAFALGTAELYRYMDYNPQIELRPCSYVNDPFVIAQNDNMVSINTALEIDLAGQVCSESIGYRQYSGTGGATDFAYGAYHSKGGRGIIALSSTTRDGRLSRIRSVLSPGAAVSISRNLVDYIVTEYGIAPMRDRPIRERVEGLIRIAHPQFREALRKEARDMLLW